VTAHKLATLVQRIRSPPARGIIRSSVRYRRAFHARQAVIAYSIAGCFRCTASRLPVAFAEASTPSLETVKAFGVPCGGLCPTPPKSSCMQDAPDYGQACAKRADLTYAQIGRAATDI